jgi:hypothetical protein
MASAKLRHHVLHAEWVPGGLPYSSSARLTSGKVTGHAAAHIGRVARLHRMIVIASVAIATSLDGNFRYAFSLHDPSTFVEAVLFILAPNKP